jgi:non-canonical poly(A) RNA polymerase PAPD5/7
MDRLSIIDPNNAANDLSGGSRNFFLISDCFSSAFHVLKTRMAQVDKALAHEGANMSILEPVIGADYSSFSRQRAKLSEVHRRSLGRCDDTFAVTPPAG